jgi:hypothetical protein
MVQKITAYYNGYAVFKLPDGIDVEDPLIVKDWWVKYNTIHIELTSGQTLEIDPEMYDTGTKYHPDNVDIENENEENQ